MESDPFTPKVLRKRRSDAMNRRNYYPSAPIKVLFDSFVLYRVTGSSDRTWSTAGRNPSSMVGQRSAKPIFNVWICKELDAGLMGSERTKMSAKCW